MKRLDRRTLLRGMLGGAAVAVGLPLFEAFVNGNGTALAAGDAFPRRFGTWFWGNGFAPGWAPTGSGATWELSDQLQPLERVKQHLTVVSGLKVYTPNEEPHGTGPRGILAGARQFQGPSLDQLLAEAIGSDTPFRSVEVSVERTASNFSRASKDQANPAEWNPAAVYARLFGEGFVEPGGTPLLDPKLALRESVLSAVRDDAERLKQRLGKNDQLRLEQHLEGVRRLEKQIRKLQENPPNLASCSRPSEPLPDYPDDAGRPQISAVSRVFADLLAMALACDRTRVFSFQICKGVSNILFPGAPMGFHQMTHDELEPQPGVRAIIRQIMDEYAYFIEALAAVPEGDQTLLDHSLVLGFTDCSYGKSHAVDDYPVILAGGASGALRKGIHYRSPAAENASKLGFSLQRMHGLPVTRFGGDEGLVSDGLHGIEA